MSSKDAYYGVFFIKVSDYSHNHRAEFEINIATAKCDLFFHYYDAKEISFCYFRDTKLCAKHEKTREFRLSCL